MHQRILVFASFVLATSACRIQAPVFDTAPVGFRAVVRTPAPPPRRVRVAPPEDYRDETSSQRGRLVRSEPPVPDYEGEPNDELNPADIDGEPDSRKNRGRKVRCPELGRDAKGTAATATLVGFGSFGGCFPGKDEFDGFIVELKKGEDATLTIKSLNEDSSFHVTIWNMTSSGKSSYSINEFASDTRIFRPKRDTRFFIRIKAYSSLRNEVYRFTLEPVAKKRPVASR